MAIKVKLRQKAISGNRQSLYLDFYPPIPHPKTGEPTRREFLGLYLIDVKNPLDKQHNKETQQLGESIRQKRENELNKPEIYTGFEKERLRIRELGEQDFVAYFKALADKRKSSNHDNWISAYNYLQTFTGGKLQFADLSVSFCEQFKEYLLTTKSKKSSKVTLSRNSVVSYFNKFKAALKTAFKEEYLQIDLNARVEGVEAEETHRNFLTLEELNKLIETDCHNPLLKRVALFSAMTGMRFSDIKNLTWRDVEYIDGDGYFIRFKQQKTKGVEMMPISEQAYGLLGGAGEPANKVFDGLKYSAYYNKHLYQWIGAAGITKDITFHCFRHTFATLQLSKGTDIYTVSKMLGHRELKTTQIYANVIDSAKRAAADKIRLDL